MRVENVEQNEKQKEQKIGRKEESQARNQLTKMRN